MANRGGRGGWAGDKSKRFMMVGNKDSGGGAAKTGVVAPVPINTPSLRQEIHGSQGENTGIASINRSSSGGGWGSASGASSSEGNPAGRGTPGGNGRARGDGTSRQGGDDVFTRHFPDLRAGLEQAEKLDAVSKASSKVAPLRKPKPEPAKSQGPSLRPRAMLKPTGSAGGGSAATAAAQAAIADAVHNRVSTAPKAEERRRPVASFADEISTKSRWNERPAQEGGARVRRGVRSGEGRGMGGSSWESNREGGRGAGRGGRGFDRGERGSSGFQEKDSRSFRHNPDRTSMNNTRGRESIFGSGGHVGMVHCQDNATNGGAKPTTTYVRQHGPPPRKLATATTTPAPTQQDSQPPAVQQPTRSSAYSASTRSSDQSREDAWGKSTEASSKGRPAQQANDAPPEASPPALDSPSSSSASYVRAHGPLHRSGQEGEVDEQNATSTSFSRQDQEAGAEPTSRFGGSWGASEHGRGALEKEPSAGVERTLSGRWKEPAGSLAPPPPPTNTRWKEPKEEPRASGRRWSREDGQMGSGRWGRTMEEDGDVDGGSTVVPSPSHSSWKESANDGWGLEGGTHSREGGEASPATAAAAAAAAAAASAASDTSEQQQRASDGCSPAITPIGAGGAASGKETAERSDVEEPAVTTGEGTSPGDGSPFRGSFARQQQQAQPVIRNASWEPQLPRGAGGGGGGGGAGAGGGGDLWETPVQGHDGHPNQQRSGQGGPSTSGGASQPWSDPWGTSGFGIPASGDQGSNSMASFLDGDEPRKDRYLPPALRNRTPSQGNHEDSANDAPADEEPNPIPPSLPDVASTDVSAQDLVIPGRVGITAPSPDGSTVVAKAPMYEQQEQQQQQQQQQQQPPLEDWQQAGGGAHASHQIRPDQTAHPVEPHLSQQQQPLQHSQQGQTAQPLHLHERAHLDRGYQRNPAESFSPFQPQNHQSHQMQEPALHPFQQEHFQAPVYPNQSQASRAPLPEQHLQRPQYRSDHVPVQRQQFGHVQIPQQVPAPQQPAQYSLHQPHQQQRPQQHGQQGYQQGYQQLDMSRQTSQAQQQQQMHIQQQHRPMQQHPWPSQGMGYADPRAAGGGGLGGLPVQMPRSYRDVPPAQQQQAAGMPPPGVYGFQSSETSQSQR